MNDHTDPDMPNLEPNEDDAPNLKKPATPFMNEQQAQAEGQEATASVNAELEARLAAAEAKAEENWDKALRASAELENVRRRAQQDVEKAHKFALDKFIADLLDVVDTLERAAEMNDANADIKAMSEGVELTFKKFITTIEKHGATPIDPLGEPFNPEEHEAMSMQENPELEPNTVMAVMQKGYSLNGRLVRPARVIVSTSATQNLNTQA